VRICLIFNPTARGDKAKRLQRHLDAIGSECALKQTRSAGDARTLAAEAVREGFEIVVAAGGDGTLNEVVNGVADEPDGLKNTRLGMLPLGTINVFAREFGIPLDLQQAWQTVTQGAEIEIDLPCVTRDDAANSKHYFAQLAGAGVDARAVELVDYGLKKKIGPLAYVYAGIKAVAADKPMIRVRDGDRETAGELVLIGNGKLYGGDYPIFDRADPSDGLLDICVFPRFDWGAVFKTGWAWLSRDWRQLGGVEYFQSREIKLSSDPPAPIEVDGEAIGRLPSTVSIDGKRLRAIVPQATAQLLESGKTDAPKATN
jgi:diacylglycerol kinase (ATP)